MALSASHSGTSSIEAYLNVEEVVEPDVDAGLWYIDQDTGIIYERDTEEGDDEETPVFTDQWTERGKISPPGDGSAPAQVTGLTVTPINVQLDDGTSVPGFEVDWTNGSEDDLIGYEVQWEGNPASWGQPGVAFVGTDGGPITVTADFIAATDYDFRVRARDVDALTAPWSSTVTATALKDSVAPEVPSGLSAIGGFKLLGLTWDKNDERDLWFYQVRVYETAGGSEEAVYFRANGTRIIVKDLTPDIEYTAEVRAVDRSGNVATSESDLTGIYFEEDLTAGWSESAAGTPTLVTPADLAVDTVVANFITTGVLSADVIEGGTLDVGGSGNTGSIEVFTSGGVPIATLDDNGLLMVNPNNSDQAMWLRSGSISFTQAYTGDVDTTTWTAAVTPEGINLSAITFGTGEGGANAIPNAGFELSSFVLLTEVVWNTSAGTPSWDDATSAVNLDTSNSYLTMTSA